MQKQTNKKNQILVTASTINNFLITDILILIIFNSKNDVQAI